MSLCECAGWARILHADKLPISEHHPRCEKYVLEEFTRVEFDGVGCVMENNEAGAMLEESDEEYIVTKVMMTRDQFERLEDFQGF